VFPVGGDHFDSDLAYGIGITARQAEHFKIHLGGVSDQYLTSSDIVEITKGDKKETIPSKIIAEIIYPRLEEILILVRENLNNAGLLKQIPSGLVLTGGTAMMPGITEMAARVFGLQARIGYPQDIDGLTDDTRNPMFATAVGLVKLGSMEYGDKEHVSMASPLTSALSTASDWGRTFLKSIFK
jgi:cell division protein FtsA